MDNSPLVYILVLNWNSFTDTIECVKSVEKLNYHNYKIIVLDNNSSDASEKILRERFPQHHFIQTGRNTGYAGGNNVGMKYAVREGADYIWILNPDIRVESDSLRTMVDVMEKEKDLGICGPVITEYEKDGSCRKVFGWRILPETGWEAEKNNDLQPDTRVDYVYGCSMLIKRKVLLEIGLLREQFFLYSEEKEFCLRARKRNWKSEIVEHARNDHYHYSKNPKAYYYCCRNSIFISRIEKQRRLETLAHHLNVEAFLKPFFRGQVKEAFFYLKKTLRKTSAVFSGIFTPIKLPLTIGLLEKKAKL